MLCHQQRQQNDKSIASNATNTEEDTENPTGEEEEQTDNIQEKIDKYQAEFEDKILDLFRGNTYYESNLTSNIMNYDSITITPKSTTTDSSNMSSTSGDSSSSDSENTDGSTDNRYSAQGNITVHVSRPSDRYTPQGNIRATVTGNQSLDVNYIRSLTPAMAATMAKNPKYTTKTRVRLIARSKQQFVI